MIWLVGVNVLRSTADDDSVTTGENTALYGKCVSRHVKNPYISHRVQVPPEDGLGGESTSKEWSWGVKGHPQRPGPLGYIIYI